jgi:hypothetical protein
MNLSAVVSEGAAATKAATLPTSEKLEAAFCFAEYNRSSNWLFLDFN